MGARGVVASITRVAIMPRHADSITLLTTGAFVVLAAALWGLLLGLHWPL